MPSLPKSRAHKLTRHLLTLSQTTRAVLAFLLATLVMLATATILTSVIESRSKSAIQEQLDVAGITWMEVQTDGMQVHLSGEAPNETTRFRALNLVGTVIDISRVHDLITVLPTSVSAPRFSVELLRNDDGIQLIGLIPEIPDADGLSTTVLLSDVADIMPGIAPTNMLQTAAWEAPEGWDEALSFGIKALADLTRSKISITAGRVRITAIANSETEKQRFERDLLRRKPRNVSLQMDISAPRPVITPFTLRFIKDAEGLRFDACSAETERDKNNILSAANRLGMTGSIDCAIGLGSPSPRWSEGAIAAIRAVAELPSAAITFADSDVTLVAGEGVTLEEFDRVAGDLGAALPDIFSLQTVAPSQTLEATGPVDFTATLRDNGRIELRGRVLDEPQQAAIEAFARGAFGADSVYLATQLDAELPTGWPIRVLAGLESMSHLVQGELRVLPDIVEIKGVTGKPDARAIVTRILSSRLGQGQTFRVDLRYDKALDPLAALPTPAECVGKLQAIIAKDKITFTPGSAELTREASPVMEAMSETLRKCPALPLEVAGYTDSQGSDSGNLALSQARAEAVVMALLGRRVDTSAMVAKGYGEADPVADNKSEEGREANRRIELRLIGGSAEASPAVASPNEETVDTSPSVAPSEKTLRPKARPETRP